MCDHYSSKNIELFLLYKTDAFDYSFPFAFCKQGSLVSLQLHW